MSNRTSLELVSECLDILNGVPNTCESTNKTLSSRECNPKHVSIGIDIGGTKCMFAYSLKSDLLAFEEESEHSAVKRTGKDLTDLPRLRSFVNDKVHISERYNYVDFHRLHVGEPQPTVADEADESDVAGVGKSNDIYCADLASELLTTSLLQQMIMHWLDSTPIKKESLIVDRVTVSLCGTIEPESQELSHSSLLSKEEDTKMPGIEDESPFSFEPGCVSYCDCPNLTGVNLSRVIKDSLLMATGSLALFNPDRSGLFHNMEVRVTSQSACARRSARLAYPNCRDLAVLVLGTNISSAFIIDGHPMGGQHGLAGFLGGCPYPVITEEDDDNADDKDPQMNDDVIGIDEDEDEARLLQSAMDSLGLGLGFSDDQQASILALGDDIDPETGEDVPTTTIVDDDEIKEEASLKDCCLDSITLMKNESSNTDDKQIKEGLKDCCLSCIESIKNTANEEADAQQDDGDDGAGDKQKPEGPGVTYETLVLNEVCGGRAILSKLEYAHNNYHVQKIESMLISQLGQLSEMHPSDPSFWELNPAFPEGIPEELEKKDDGSVIDCSAEMDQMMSLQKRMDEIMQSANVRFEPSMVNQVLLSGSDHCEDDEKKAEENEDQIHPLMEPFSEIVDDATSAMALAVCTTLNMCNPRRVVFAGGVLKFEGFYEITLIKCRDMMMKPELFDDCRFSMWNTDKDYRSPTEIKSDEYETSQSVDNLVVLGCLFSNLD